MTTIKISVKINHFKLNNGFNKISNGLDDGGGMNL